MRWLFLLLLILNGVYYVWHQQEAPLRAKEVEPLALYRSAHQDIQLLSETVSADGRPKGVQSRKAECVYLGSVARQEFAQLIQGRLQELSINARVERIDDEDLPGFWVRVAPESRHLLDEALLQRLSKEFNELKHKIMPCEGIATAE